MKNSAFKVLKVTALAMTLTALLPLTAAGAAEPQGFKDFGEALQQHMERSGEEFMNRLSGDRDDDDRYERRHDRDDDRWEHRHSC